MMALWKTSVDELLQIFRSALLALLPSMQRARIPWKTGEAYDEWDEISQTLYRNIVARSIHAAVAETVELDRVLPRYDMKLQSYSDCGVLLVSGSKSATFTVFVGLSSKDEPFDTVDCLSMDALGCVSGDIIKQPFDTARFFFVPKLGDQLDVIGELCLEL